MTQTKRELREQRRAHRLAAEQAAAAADTRRRRRWRLHIAAGLAAILVAVVAAVSNSKDAPPPTTDAASLVAGISGRRTACSETPTRRSPSPSTSIFSARSAPQAAEQTLPTLINDYVKTGKVKLQARTLSFLGPDSVRAAKVAAGAKEQGRLWAFLETFYASQGTENSGYVTDDFLREVAAAACVNTDKALDFADAPDAQRALDEADSDAAAVKADSTPTFTIKRGDGPETIARVGVTDLTEGAGAMRVRRPSRSPSWASPSRPT